MHIDKYCTYGKMSRLWNSNSQVAA